MTNNKQSNTDDDLFKQSLGDVEPIEQQRPDPFRQRRSPRPLYLDDGSEDEYEQLVEEPVEATDELFFARPGIQQRVIRDLKRGYLEVGMELDLHGLTVRHAWDVLNEFLAECHYHDIRCVRIIHGKGSRSDQRQPVLKQKLNTWLRQIEDVLAFTSATKRDGGTGAVYVLLRNPNKLKPERRRNRRR